MPRFWEFEPEEEYLRRKRQETAPKPTPTPTPTPTPAPTPPFAPSSPSWVSSPPAPAPSPVPSWAISPLQPRERRESPFAGLWDYVQKQAEESAGAIENLFGIEHPPQEAPAWVKGASGLQSGMRIATTLPFRLGAGLYGAARAAASPAFREAETPEEREEVVAHGIMRYGREGVDKVLDRISGFFQRVQEDITEPAAGKLWARIKGISLPEDLEQAIERDLSDLTPEEIYRGFQMGEEQALSPETRERLNEHYRQVYAESPLLWQLASNIIFDPTNWAFLASAGLSGATAVAGSVDKARRVAKIAATLGAIDDVIDATYIASVSHSATPEEFAGFLATAGALVAGTYALTRGIGAILHRAAARTERVLRDAVQGKPVPAEDLADSIARVEASRRDLIGLDPQTTEMRRTFREIARRAQETFGERFNLASLYRSALENGETDFSRLFLRLAMVTDLGDESALEVLQRKYSQFSQRESDLWRSIADSLAGDRPIAKMVRPALELMARENGIKIDKRASQAIDYIVKNLNEAEFNKAFLRSMARDLSPVKNAFAVNRLGEFFENFFAGDEAGYFRPFAFFAAEGEGGPMPKKKPIIFSEIFRGPEVNVQLPANQIARGRYAVVDVRALVPFREPESLLPSKRYFSALRRFSEQLGDISHILRDMEGDFPFEAVLPEGESFPFLGPPVVDQAGRVIAGNLPAMALQRLQRDYPEAFEKYKAVIASVAEQFGLDPAEVMREEAPVLVRVVDLDEPVSISILRNSLPAEIEAAPQAIAAAQNLPRREVDIAASSIDDVRVTPSEKPVSPEITAQTQEPIIEEPRAPKEAKKPSRKKKSKIDQEAYEYIEKENSLIPTDMETAQRLGINSEEAFLRLFVDGGAWPTTGAAKEAQEALHQINNLYRKLEQYLPDISERNIAEIIDAYRAADTAIAVARRDFHIKAKLTELFWGTRFGPFDVAFLKPTEESATNAAIAIISHLKFLLEADKNLVLKEELDILGFDSHRDFWRIGIASDDAIESLKQRIIALVDQAFPSAPPRSFEDRVRVNLMTPILPAFHEEFTCGLIPPEEYRQLLQVITPDHIAQGKVSPEILEEYAKKWAGAEKSGKENVVKEFANKVLSTSEPQLATMPEEPAQPKAKRRSRRKKKEEVAPPQIIEEARQEQLTLSETGPVEQPTLSETAPAEALRPAEETIADPSKLVAASSGEGDRYLFQYDIVSLEDLIASHNLDMTRNPKFPPYLQPRERERAASRLQIESMAQKLDPFEILEETHRINTGPMIVGPDMVVESGNARVLALRLAKEMNGDSWRKYQEALRNKLSDPDFPKMLTPEALQRASQIDDPVLVRRRVSDVDREEFVRKANEGGVLSMSDVQKGKIYADRFPDSVLFNLEIPQGENLRLNDFLLRKKELANTLASVVPKEELGLITDEKGYLSQAGLNLLKATLFLKAYSGEAGENLARNIFEKLGPNSRIQMGLLESLPKVAKAEALIASGLRDPSLSITEDMAVAIQKLVDLSNQNLPVSHALSMQEMFDEGRLTPFQQRLLAFLGDEGNKKTVIRRFMELFADEIINSKPTGQTTLIDVGVPTKDEIFDRVIQKLYNEGEEVSLPEMFKPSPFEKSLEQEVRERGEAPITTEEMFRPVEPTGIAEQPEVEARPAAEGAAEEAPQVESGTIFDIGRGLPSLGGLQIGVFLQGDPISEIPGFPRLASDLISRFKKKKSSFEYSPTGKNRKIIEDLFQSGIGTKSGATRIITLADGTKISITPFRKTERGPRRFRVAVEFNDIRTAFYDVISSVGRSLQDSLDAISPPTDKLSLDDARNLIERAFSGFEEKPSDITIDILARLGMSKDGSISWSELKRRARALVDLLSKSTEEAYDESVANIDTPPAAIFTDSGGVIPSEKLPIELTRAVNSGIPVKVHYLIPGRGERTLVVKGLEFREGADGGYMIGEVLVRFGEKVEPRRIRLKLDNIEVLGAEEKLRPVDVSLFERLFPEEFGEAAKGFLLQPEAIEGGLESFPQLPPLPKLPNIQEEVSSTMGDIVLTSTPELHGFMAKLRQFKKDFYSVFADPFAPIYKMEEELSKYIKSIPAREDLLKYVNEADARYRSILKERDALAERKQKLLKNGENVTGIDREIEKLNAELDKALAEVDRRRTVLALLDETSRVISEEESAYSAQKVARYYGGAVGAIFETEIKPIIEQIPHPEAFKDLLRYLALRNMVDEQAAEEARLAAKAATREATKKLVGKAAEEKPQKPKEFPIHKRENLSPEILEELAKMGVDISSDEAIGKLKAKDVLAAFENVLRRRNLEVERELGRYYRNPLTPPRAFQRRVVEMRAGAVGDEAYFNLIRETATKLTNFFDQAIIGRLLEAGMLNPKAAQRMRNVYKSGFWPAVRGGEVEDILQEFQELLSEKPPEDSPRRGIPRDLFTFRDEFGSTEPFVSTFGAMMSRLYDVEWHLRYNEGAKRVARLWTLVCRMRGEEPIFYEEIPKDTKLQKKIISYFVPERPGKAFHMLVPEDWARAVVEMQPLNLHGILKFMSKITSAFKYFVIGINTAWALFNLPRDLFNMWRVRGTNILFPTKIASGEWASLWPRAMKFLWQFITSDKKYYEIAKKVAMPSASSYPRLHTDERILDIIYGKKIHPAFVPGKMMFNILEFPTKISERLSDAVGITHEIFARGASLEKPYALSRRMLSLRYDPLGYSLRLGEIQAIMPFIHARIDATRQMVRHVKEDPTWFFFTTATLIGAKVVQELWNRQFASNKKVPLYERMAGFPLIIGEVTIPPDKDDPNKPPETYPLRLFFPAAQIEPIFMLPVVALFDRIDKDASGNDLLRMVIGTIYSMGSPVEGLPRLPFITSIFEAVSNYDYFRRMPIVGQALSTLPLTLQQRVSGSRLSILISEGLAKIGVFIPPATIEHMMTADTGGLEVPLFLVDMLLGLLGYDPEPFGEAWTVPEEEWIVKGVESPLINFERIRESLPVTAKLTAAIATAPVSKRFLRLFGDQELRDQYDSLSDTLIKKRIDMSEVPILRTYGVNVADPKEITVAGKKVSLSPVLREFYVRVKADMLIDAAKVLQDMEEFNAIEDPIVRREVLDNVSAAIGRNINLALKNALLSGDPKRIAETLWTREFVKEKVPLAAIYYTQYQRLPDYDISNFRDLGIIPNSESFSTLRKAIDERVKPYEATGDLITINRSILVERTIREMIKAGQIDKILEDLGIKDRPMEEQVRLIHWMYFNARRNPEKERLLREHQRLFADVYGTAVKP